MYFTLLFCVLGMALLVAIAVILLSRLLSHESWRCRGKGAYGEETVASLLQSLPKEYHIFNDIYILVDGRSIQIDHVVISVYGIFVIETKNYGGWIFGSDRYEKWIENFYGQKYYFYNPVKQNYTHLKALQKVLRIPIDKFVSVVVFLERAELKCNTKGNVIYSSELNDFIKGYNQAIMTPSHVDNAINTLSNALVADEGIKKAHAKNAQERVKRYEDYRDTISSSY